MKTEKNKCREVGMVVPKITQTRVFGMVTNTMEHSYTIFNDHLFCLTKTKAIYNHWTRLTQLNQWTELLDSLVFNWNDTSRLYIACTPCSKFSSFFVWWPSTIDSSLKYAAWIVVCWEKGLYVQYTIYQAFYAFNYWTKTQTVHQLLFTKAYLNPQCNRFYTATTSWNSPSTFK